MAKTVIEWCDYVINPIRGLCPIGCPYCYAIGFYHRFRYHKDGTPNPTWNPEIRLDTDCFLPFLQTIRKKPSKIFVGSTMELFGEWVQTEWMDFIFERVKMLPEHTFIFLTKRPENLIKWSPFPRNCWVGVSATNNDMAWAGSSWLRHIQAGLKFISFEPLLEPMHSKDGKLDFSRAIVEQLDWLIIGQQTPVKASTRPNPDWIREIITAANYVNIPIFIKDNIINDKVLDLRLQEMRQEFPKVSIA